jgi:hypothetical protein
VTTFLTFVKDGKLPHAVGLSVKAAIMALEGKKAVVTIEEWKPKRSLAQNRLYHKWTAELADQTGSTRDAMHEYLKRHFLGVDAKEVFGEVVEVSRSTTGLKTGQMVDYLTKIEALASENNMSLTRPFDYEFAMGNEE